MQEELIRVKRASEMTGLGISTIWMWSAQGKFPKPMKLSDRVTVWKLSDIQKYITEQIRLHDEQDSEVVA